MKSNQKAFRLFKVSLILAFVTMTLVGVSSTVHSDMPDTYALIAPDLSHVQVSTLVTNVPFTITQTGLSDSPAAKIRATVTNQPEGAVVSFIQTTGGAQYNVINDDYSSAGSFVIPVGQNRTDTFDIQFSMVGDYTIRYSLVDLNEANPDIMDVEVPVSVVGTKPEPLINGPDSLGRVQIDSNHSEAVISSAVNPVTITIADGVDHPTLNFASLLTNLSATLPKITISSSAAMISIPASTLTSDISWNGIINAPNIASTTLADTVDESRTVATAIEVGTTGSLTFDRGVRIMIPRFAGKRVGVLKDTTFTEISSVCADDSQSSGDALPGGGDCKTDVGSDLVVWTKHFSTFVAFTASAKTPSETPALSSGHLSTATTTTITTVSTTTANDTTPSIPVSQQMINNNSSTTSSTSTDIVAVSTNSSNPDSSSTATTIATASVIDSHPSIILIFTVIVLILVGGGFYFAFK